ncbi:polysaccharide pyruvyl transferase [Sediminihabitans luteus]|uniref:Polysaccharide pyruvyl transferase n=1 Tax=Sediminihabitans luteus TaxID=1138585 RepID=A0A2M9CPR1_9CELL|nr:polysaccharide pyruvyl transferase family protein [Sediminihabitans luteus]PJJ73892.1 polysaccharide pyruvyl transferase [Sediminihabitans luteus]GII98196.1 exoV-like protein [Sediminihabitans luteus]
MADRKAPVDLYWWRWKYPHRLNFGDEISGPIIEALTGRRVRWASAETCELVAAGSVIQQLTRTKRKQMPVFWGSGLINPPRENARPLTLPAVAVRGQLTRTRVRSTLADDVALGDPGILADQLLRRPPRKRFTVGVLPHYQDAADPNVDALIALGSQVRRIEVTWTPEEVVNEIASCDVLLSSSLHGIIVADSVGVPSVHLKFSDRLMGGEYKFRDYNSIYSPGRQQSFAMSSIPTRSATAIADFVNSRWVPPTGIERHRERLAKVLPL